MPKVPLHQARYVLPASLSITSASFRRPPLCIPSSRRLGGFPRQHSIFHRHLATMAPIERIADKLEKPALDDRSYRVIRLPNNLEALLVHDPETDKASASVNVNVGSFSDADDMPGMAHAVEHLLFMGTEKVLCHNFFCFSSLLKLRSIRSRMITTSTSLPIPATLTPTPALPKPTTSLKLLPLPSKALPKDLLPLPCTEPSTASPSSLLLHSSFPRPSTENSKRWIPKTRRTFKVMAGDCHSSESPFRAQNIRTTIFQPAIYRR